MTDKKTDKLLGLCATGVNKISKTFLINESQLSTEAPTLVLDHWLESLKSYCRGPEEYTGMFERYMKEWVEELELREKDDTTSDRDLILGWLKTKLCTYRIDLIWERPIVPNMVEDEINATLFSLEDKRPVGKKE